jgi:apolipoprotein N-acyltransferase
MTDGIFIYPVLTASLWYLFSRAKITEPIWSSYGDGDFAYMMDCAACAGFWWGLVVHNIGIFWSVPFLSVTNPWALLLMTPVVMVMSAWWTPVLAAVHDRAMTTLGHTVAGPNDE